MGVKYSNNAETTLSSGINNSTTSISVASSSSFPAITGSDYFYATIDDATNLEIVKVTAVSGTTWTVVRAQDDTTARAFSSGDTVELRINTAMLTDVVNDARTSTFVKQAFTGDGSTTDYTLSQTPGSENDLIVFIEGVFQTQSAYSLSGAVLSFSAAPANTREIVVYHLTDAVSGDSMYHNSYTGNGSTTAYTLSIDPIHENNLIVFLDGVYQNRSTYSVSGTTLTLDAAPANGVAIEVTIHTQTEINVPATNSVGTAQLQDNSVTSAKIAADVIVAEDLAANSITVAELSKTALSGQTGVTAAANDYVLIGDASDSDNLKKALISSITATTSSVSALTASGVVTANAGVVVDNITIDGTEIDLSSGDLTIDAAGRIDLSADDNGEIRFYDGGLMYGQFKEDSSNLVLQSLVSDKDLILRGNDDGTEITALTLDMSAAGAATFNNKVTATQFNINSSSYDNRQIGVDSNGFFIYNAADSRYDLKIDDSGSNFTFGGDITLGDASGATITMNDTDTSQEDFAFVLGANALAMRKTSNSNDIMRLDLTNERVGIGTASPSRQLTVSSSGQTDVAIIAGTSSSAQLQFGDSGDDNIGQIEYNNSTNNMVFYANATEHMRINSNGNINIGIGGSGGDLLLQPLAKLYLDAGGDTYIVESSGNEIDIYTGGARRLRINQDGLIFNTDTATANALSDYEEGTWTPTYTVDGGGSAGTVTSTNVATYTKIGNLVHCRVRSFYVPTSGTVPTAYNISLPFQAKNNGGLAGYGVGREIAQNGKSLFIEVDGNQTAGKIKCKDGSAPPANAYIDIAFTYEAA